MASRKLEVVFYDATIEGIKIIKDKLFPITGYVIPRRFLSQAKEIDDIHNPGIYYLVDEDVDGRISKIYHNNLVI